MKNKLINWIFFLALFLIFLLPPTDPDLGWHLRCGEEIWSRLNLISVEDLRHEVSGQKYSLCSQNQFSVLLENYSWPNHYWLYQSIIFPVYSHLGLWGLTVFNTFLMSFAFFFFYLAVKNYRWEKMLAMGLIIFLSWGVFSFGIRSQLMGFFFFSLLLWLFAKIEQEPKLVLLFPLIMLVWANSHGSVIIGLVLLFFFKPFVFLFSAPITLLNPFGWKIYQEAWRHFAVVDLSKLIAEWVPPNKTNWWLILASSLGLFFYLLAGERAKDKILAFLVAPFALLALKARRNVPFYFLLGFYLFFTSSTTKNTLASWLKKKSFRNNLAGLTTMAFLFFGLFIRLPQTIDTNLSWQNYCQRPPLTYPCQAIEFLKTQSDKGNIFNRYEWGGVLIWQLPEYKVFVDGRMPAWPTPSGKSPYTIYLETLQTQPGWQETLNKYNIDWILISPDTFMDLKLKPNPEKFDWEEVYRDKISVIYKRI